MNKKKRYSTSVLLLLVVMTITACSGKQSDSTDNTVVAYKPQYSKYEYTFDKSKEVYSNFYGMFIQGDELYCISSNNSRMDTVNIIDISTGEHSEKQLDSTASYYRTGTGFAGFKPNKLIIYDKNFDKTGEVDLSKFIAELNASGESLLIYNGSNITMDTEGNIGIVSNMNTLYMVDANGMLLSRTECPDNMSRIEMVFVTNAGSWYIVCGGMNYGDTVFYPVDIKSGTLGDGMEDILYGDNNTVVDICPVDADDFYIFSRNYVYRYISESSTSEELCCLREYGVEIDSQGMGVGSGFGMFTDNMPGIINYTCSQTDEDADVRDIELVTFVRTEGKVSQRTELVAATISEPSFKEREAVMRFNKYNPDYYITFKTYLDEDYHTDDRKEKVRLAQQSFNNDLVSGKGADIYFSPYGELDFENLGEKGALADLYEFIDADSDISRDDFVQSILKAMEYKGKLYAVSPDFSLNTIVGKKSLLGQYDKWDYNAVYELAKSHPDAILFANSNQEKNLDKFMAYSLDMFYNSDTAECGFDSEQFIKLLELAKDSGTEYDNSADIGELLKDEKVLLYEAPIMSWEAIQCLPYYFGEDISYVGYPSNAESGTVLRYYYQWAVSGQSQHKDGAWQFIKSLFDDAYQKSCLYFPVMRSSFDDVITEAMNFNERHSVGLTSGVSVNVHAMTQEEADELRQFVDNATLVYKPYDTVKNIIKEEAEYLFDGVRSAEETAAIIQDRVKLYLEENN